MSCSNGGPGIGLIIWFLLRIIMIKDETMMIFRQDPSDYHVEPLLPKRITFYSILCESTNATLSHGSNPLPPREFLYRICTIPPTVPVAFIPSINTQSQDKA